MGTSASRKAARRAAAIERDAKILEAGGRDPMLLDWLEQSRKLDPDALERAIQRVMKVAGRPSHPDYQRALIVLGAARSNKSDG